MFYLFQEVTFHTKLFYKTVSCETNITMSRSLSGILKWLIDILIEAFKKPFKIVRGMKEEGTYSYLKERMEKPGKDEILEGNILVVMFKLGWPIMLATFLRTLYNLADTFWLGRLPGELAEFAVAASSQAWSVVFVIMSVEIGFGVAALALISQYTGSRDYEKASEYAGQLYFIVILFSAILGAIGYFATPHLMELLVGTGPDAPYLAYYGTQYLQITFMGMPFMFLFFAFMFIMRGWGDNVTPMKIVAVTSIINILIDPILIFGSGYELVLGPLEITMPTIFGYSIPMLGVRGAALASVLSRGVAAFYSIYLMFTGKVGIEVDFSQLIPDFKKIKKIFTVGIPASFGRLGSSTGFLLLWAIVYRLPDTGTVAAAYGAGNKILNIMHLVMGGMTMAIATMVGQSLGADMIKRAENTAKKGMITLAILTAIIAAVLFVGSNTLIRILVPGQEGVIESGAHFLMIYSLSIPFFGIFRAISQILGGSGHTVQQMGLDLARIWAFRLVLVYIFALVIGLHDIGFWMGMSVSNIVASGAAFVVYSKGWWKEKIIDEEPSPGPTIPKDDKSESEDVEA